MMQDTSSAQQGVAADLIYKRGLWLNSQIEGASLHRTM